MMKKAQFMGRMSATISHDLCNVLATIQQASGLLADYLALARKESLKSVGLRPKFKYNDKFEEIINQVQAQVNRGQDMCEYLSNLAHSPDDGQEASDLERAAQLMLKLSGRVAKKHRVNLQVRSSGKACMAAVPLIEVLALIEAALLGVVCGCAEPGDIVFAPGEDGEGVHVDILCPVLGDGEAQSLVESLVGEESGPFKAGVVRGGVRLSFKKA